jgi:hypothetical protein
MFALRNIIIPIFIINFVILIDFEAILSGHCSLNDSGCFDQAVL